MMSNKWNGHDVHNLTGPGDRESYVYTYNYTGISQVMHQLLAY